MVLRYSGYNPALVSGIQVDARKIKLRKLPSNSLDEIFVHQCMQLAAGSALL
jgi:hypothetical protein